MANNNLITDFEDYRNAAVATDVFRNTSGADRFFAYVGPNGKTLSALGPNNIHRGGEVVVSADSFVHPQGILAKQAIARDLALGNIKVGNKGVTIVRIKSLTGTTAQTTTATGSGRIVGAWYVPTAGTATGNITITNPTATPNTGVVTATITSLSNATINKVLQLVIDVSDTTGRDVVAGDVITCTPGATGNVNTTGDVFLAIAYHSI